MPLPVVPLIRRLLDLVRYLYRLAAPTPVFRSFLHAWTWFSRQLVGQENKGGGDGGKRSKLPEAGDLQSSVFVSTRASHSVLLPHGGIILAASRLPQSLTGSPSSGVEETVDTSSRPVSIVESSRPPSITFEDSLSVVSTLNLPASGDRRETAETPDRPPHSRQSSYDASYGSGALNASPSSYDVYQLDSVSETHRGRTFQPSSPSNPRRRSRSPHVSVGVVTRPRPHSHSPAPSRIPRPISSRTGVSLSAPEMMQQHHPQILPDLPITPSETQIGGAEIDALSFLASTLSTVNSTQLPDVYPVHEIDRYDRNIKLPKKRADYKYTIHANTLEFPRDRVPKGWVTCQHPEGALYFVREEERIYTDAHLCDPAVLEQVEGCIKRLQIMVEERGLVFPADVDLVIEPSEYEERHYWSYYYANHSNRTLFWLDDYEFPDHELDGEPTVPQIQHELECFYWRHVECFPHLHETTQDTIDELIGIISWAMVDQQTSPSSTVSAPVDDLEKMLVGVEHAKKLGSNDYSVAIIARLHANFGHLRYLNYHGQYGARLNREQSVHGDITRPRTILVRLLAPALFNAPYLQLQALENIWVDNTLSHLAWQPFVRLLNDQWQAFIIPATVLLSTNVAFLAIPSVDSDTSKRTAAQVLSYISLLCSAGCTIVGLLLVRHYSFKSRASPMIDSFVNSLYSAHPTLGLEAFAIIYSLPYALMMWSMITFLIAISFECFATPDRVALSISGAAWAIVGLLGVWSIYHAAWEASDEPFYKKIYATYNQILQSLRGQAQDLVQNHFSCLVRTRPPDSNPDV